MSAPQAGRCCECGRPIDNRKLCAAWVWREAAYRDEPKPCPFKTAGISDLCGSHQKVVERGNRVARSLKEALRFRKDHAADLLVAQKAYKAALLARVSP